jgi:hypothetical protein
MQNYLKSTLKNVQNLLFFDTPKWIFISGPGHLAHEKMVENHSKSSKVTLKATKNFTTSPVFGHPNIAFHFWTKPIDAYKNH